MIQERKTIMEYNGYLTLHLGNFKTYLLLLFFHKHVYQNDPLKKKGPITYQTVYKFAFKRDWYSTSYVKKISSPKNTTLISERKIYRGEECVDNIKY